MAEENEELELLRMEAEDLGIEVDGRWGEKKLRQAIAEAKDGDESEPESAPEPVSGFVVRNLLQNPQAIGSHVLKPEESLELSDKDQKNGRLMARVQHGLKTGALAKD